MYGIDTDLMTKILLGYSFKVCNKSALSMHIRLLYIIAITAARIVHWNSNRELQILNAALER